MGVWQSLVHEYERLLDALVTHPHWEEALLCTPELQTVAVHGREAIGIAQECHESYLEEGLAEENEANLDVVIFKTQASVRWVRDLLDQLDGNVPERPVRQVN